RKTKETQGYSKLPDRARLLISAFVVKAHSTGRPVRLSSPESLHPVWPVNLGNVPCWDPEYFDSLGEVLAALHSYTSVCFAMRVDILATLFLTHHFHVVYS
ncbi:hypothetical protein QBC47DRAFT_279718, partial [Echria macrotheca]